MTAGVINGRFRPFAVSSVMDRERPQLCLLLSKRDAASSLRLSVRHFECHVQSRLRCVRSGQLTLYSLCDLGRWVDDEATISGPPQQDDS